MSPANYRQVVGADLQGGVFVFCFCREFRVNNVTFSAADVVVGAGGVSAVLPTFVRVGPMVQRVPKDESQ